MAEHGISTHLIDLQSSHVLDVLTYEGYGWHSSLKPRDLKNLQKEYRIPDTALLEIPLKDV